MSDPPTTDDRLASWRADPARFIETVLHDPETNKPFRLLDAQRLFFAHAWQRDDSGRLKYPEQVVGMPKKSGKSATAGMHVLTTVLLFGGKYAEGYALANDQEQAQGRVFQAIRRIVECSPLLYREARITSDKIVFPAFSNAVICAIASDAASAAGANPVISSFDELWAFASERGFRLFDEMIPPPTRTVACRLTTTYAGYTGKSALLESLYRRGLAQPEIAPDLHAGDGILMFWTHEPVAPWQDERWIAEMRRSLRPLQFARMIRNEWVASENSFIDVAAWDRCVDPDLKPVLADKALPIWVGVDASVKHDSTACVCVTWSQKHQHVRLVAHKIFQPTPETPIDFVAEVEQTLLDWRDRFNLQKIFYDPYQMAASAQRLAREGLVLEEYPQHPANLTALAQNLFDLITDRNLAVYPNEATRLAISRAVAVESGRGWRITKEKQAHKIDFVIALGLAALAAVRAQANFYNSNYLGWQDTPPANADYDGAKAWRENRLYYTGPPDGYAHAAWARLRMQEQIDHINRTPLVPADLLDLIEKCTPRPNRGG